MKKVKIQLESIIVGFFRAYIGWLNKQHEQELELRRRRPRSPLPSPTDGSRSPDGGSYNINVKRLQISMEGGQIKKQSREIFPLLDLWTSNFQSSASALLV